MDRIVLKNMGFYGYHGNLESEQSQGQRFYVDVEVKTDLTKAGQIYNTVNAVMTGEPRHLLEKLGALIADELWNNYKGIVGLSVTVRKPSVPIAGMLDYVEVITTRGQF